MSHDASQISNDMTLPPHTPDSVQIDVLLDTQGLICPEPMMMLHQAMRKMMAGQTVQVLATDPSTQRDIPKFCMHLRHELLKNVASDNSPAVFTYIIKKQG